MANIRFLFLILLCVILIPLKGPDTSITFIDVGQGDGIFIRSGENILIDGGSSSTKKIGKYTLEPFLKSQCINHIDKLFISHADNDHTNGIIYLAQSGEFTVDDLYLPACAAYDDKYSELVSAFLSTSHPKINYIKAGDVIALGRGKLTCMSPFDDTVPDDMNDQSLILLYREDTFTALFTGDAGKAAEAEMLEAIDRGVLPSVEGLTLLKVGHHGSKNSTSDALVKAASPLIAILSYGSGNRYGHPNTETTDLLKQYHVRMLRTAQSGAITLTTDGSSSVSISLFCGY